MTCVIKMGNMDNMDIMYNMIIIVNMGPDKIEMLILVSVTLMSFASTRKCCAAATASRTGWKITSELFLG